MPNNANYHCGLDTILVGIVVLLIGMSTGGPDPRSDGNADPIVSAPTSMSLRKKRNLV